MAEAPAAGDAGPLAVYAVNYPLAYFAERLAGERVEVSLPVPAGIDPAFWKPSAEEISQYQSADLILLNGAGYARWTRYATLPRSRTVVTSEGCREAFLPSGEAVQHRHGPEGEHAHDATAFTTWLDMKLATCQAARVRDALIAVRPGDAQTIRERFDALERELDSIDQRLREAAGALGDQALLASHPVYQYLADGYGLTIESLHLEPDRALGPDELRALDDTRAAHSADLMLWEAPPLRATRDQLTSKGVKLVVFDPASQRPAAGTFVDVMSENAHRRACGAGTEVCR